MEALLGNERLKAGLAAAFAAGGLAHCYLIAGPAGSGKHTLARILAAAMECTEGEKRPCGRCLQCRKVLDGVHPDVITVDDPARKIVPVELIRKYRADVYIKPNEGLRKVYLIPRAMDMNAAAQNALLKVIEEPPDYAAFLLLTDSAERLLPTIRSRVQTITMRGEGAKAKSETDAAFAELLVAWLRLLFKLKMKELSVQVDKMAALNREQQKQFLGYTLGVMRDCFLHGAAGLPVDIGSGDQKFDTMFPTMVTVNNVEMIEQALDEAIMAVERNANAKIALMQLSFSMSRALKKR